MTFITKVTLEGITLMTELQQRGSRQQEQRAGPRTDSPGGGDEQAVCPARSWALVWRPQLAGFLW